MENAMKHIHRTRGDRIFDAINVAALCLLLAVILYPLIYVLSCSFSDPLLVVQSKITFLPMQPTLVAYQRVFRNELIMTGYQNTLFYTLLGTVLNVAVTTMMAYPLSRHGMPGNKLIMKGIVFTMIFSAGTVPTYLIVKATGLLNTMFAMFVPGMISVYNLIITKAFFEGLPEELFESARLDGCTEFGVLWRIVLPMSLPIMMTIGMYYAVAHWNAYMVAVLYITDQDLRPLQVILRRMLKAANMDMSADEVVPAETLKMAAVCFATAPIVVIYPFIQKYFVKGTLAGAVKG